MGYGGERMSKAKARRVWCDEWRGCDEQSGCDERSEL